MTDAPARPNLRIDPVRLWDDLMESARFGGTPGGGIRRLALSAEDKAVRAWFTAQCEALGCAVETDAVGTQVARRPGRNPALAPIAFGSHLDTQPTGGKFDGVLGVLAGLEVLRTLHRTGYETNAPLELVNWTNEEGARFAPAMLASGVYAGVFSPDFALSRADGDGVTFGEALEHIGARGPGAVSNPLSGYFELHIEQGPILEAEGAGIGVVTAVQGMRWYDVAIEGEAAHTGATPMTRRRDALLGAARIVEAVNRLAEGDADVRASVGTLRLEPGSRNVVPARVEMSVDLRHPDEARLDALEEGLRAALERELGPLGLGWTLSTVWASPAVRFDPALVACVREGAARSSRPTRDLVSGAGHDAAYVARVAPAAMIFVPCAGGVSHNEAEAITPEDAAAGAQVLLDAVLAFDRTLGG